MFDWKNYCELRSIGAAYTPMPTLMLTSDPPVQLWLPDLGEAEQDDKICIDIFIYHWTAILFG